MRIIFIMGSRDCPEVENAALDSDFPKAYGLEDLRLCNRQLSLILKVLEAIHSTPLIGIKQP